jgi:predicted transcriptional regulator YdeE
MTALLKGLLVHDLTGYVPRIVELDTTLKSIYRDVPGLGKRFKELKRAHPIPYRREPWAFAAVSSGFVPETGAMHYMLGDVVTQVKEVPEGMQAFDIPAITYAVFPVRPKNRFGWGLEIAGIKGYAYTVWLPKSGYQVAGIIDDFEFHDERSVRKHDPEVDLYVAVKRRS